MSELEMTAELRGVLVPPSAEPLARYESPHRLSNVDPDERRAVCSVCGPVRIRSKGWQAGSLRFVCAKRHEQKRMAKRLGRHPDEWSDLKDETCERCGFTPEHPVQLDLHNHRDPDNRQTLCANCHRLVTHQESGAGREGRKPE